MNSSRESWNRIYEGFSQARPSWYQDRPSPSLEWILEFLPYRKVRIIDVGGGSSLLVDHLLTEGYLRPAVLDISEAALALAQARLGPRQAFVQWIHADITVMRPTQPFAFWHDRCFFHHLVDEESRRAYCHALWGSLLPGGLALLATYAPGSPETCSGLPVHPYTEDELAKELGPAFRLRLAKTIHHVAVGGERTQLTYALFEKV